MYFCRTFVLANNKKIYIHYYSLFTSMYTKKNDLELTL